MTVQISPCVGLCRIDVASDLCTGCARSRAEIAAWRTMARDALDAVWAALPSRRASLGIDLHRLPWGADEVREFVLASLRRRSGTWVFGVPGAVAEFSVAEGEAASLSSEADSVSCATARGAVRFSGFGRMRALSFGKGPPSGVDRVVALVVPRDRLASAPDAGLAKRGPDVDALVASGRAAVLYDLGLGTSPSRFCVRVDDPDLRAVIDADLGMAWRDHLGRIGPSLVAASPHRVVTSPAGRAEVFTRIPPPGGASQPGPHTHLLPASLLAGHEAPPALGIPDLYAVGAIHYPGPSTE